MKCLQCESDDIIRNVRVVDRGDHHAKYNLSLEVYANPKAWVFKDTKTGHVRANVCADCGFVMMTVSKADAQKLKRAKATGGKKRRIN